MIKCINCEETFNDPDELKREKQLFDVNHNPFYGACVSILVCPHCGGNEFEVEEEE